MAKDEMIGQRHGSKRDYVDGSLSARLGYLILTALENGREGERGNVDVEIGDRWVRITMLPNSQGVEIRYIEPEQAA